MLKLKENNIYQFKITLCEIEPKIWRRIQVPGNYNFHKFHLAIQHAMGWTDSHLHHSDKKLLPLNLMTPGE